MLGGQGGHIRVEAQGADVIDDGGSGVQGGPGHLGLIGIDGDGDVDFGGQGFDDRQDPAQFLIQRHGIGKGPGGFAADIQDVGAGHYQGPGLGQGGVRVEKAAAVGKGVGGDVEHPHDQGARRRQERRPDMTALRNLHQAGGMGQARHG